MLVGLTLKTDPIRVLFVEDDENYREIIGDELSYHGFVVHSFADGDSLLGSLDRASMLTSSFSIGRCPAFRASTCSLSCAAMA